MAPRDRTLHHSEGCGLCKVHKWCPCSTLDKMLLFRVEIIVVASSIAVPGKEEEESKFRSMLTCSSREVSVIPILDHKSVR